MSITELPNDALLAVIDMQVGFQETGSEWQVPRYAEAETQVSRLAAAFDEQVVWTRFVRDPAEKGAWADYYDRWSTFRVDEDSRQWDLTIDPPPAHPVISLPTFSKWGPELGALVPVSAPLVLCGVSTDCCVLATALSAIDAGRSVIVVTDACAAVNDQAQEQTVQLLGLLSPMVSLTTTDQILGALR